jgi:hypothetical protein
MADTKFSLILDGSTDFLGGQDASKDPANIETNCYAAGINVAVSRGCIRPRWPWERKEISFEDGIIENRTKIARTYKELFEFGKFQMAAPYYVGADRYIILVVNGLIYAFNIETNRLIHLPISDGSQLNPRATRVNWSAAGDYLVIFDFPARPIIIDKLYARRSFAGNMEVPVACIGAFNENRLYIGNAGTEFTGGDPVGSTATPNAPITFQEVLTEQSPYYGQIFKLPTTAHNNPITFMGFLQVTDTSTGIGSLLIGTSNALYAFATQNPRESWETQSFGSIVCYNAGVVGPRAFVNVNSDAFFLSYDGYVRSLSMSREEQQRWARVPLSREVENWFKYWDNSLKPLAFTSAFNNKIFFSVNPYRVAVSDFDTSFPISDYAHQGFVVLELDNLSSFGEPTRPTWAGLWTGISPMDAVCFEDRMFIISKDSSNINRIYEVNPELTYDSANCRIRPIRSRVYTRLYEFEDAFSNKELHSIDLNFENLKGDFKLDVAYKPIHAASFIPWRSFTHKAPWRDMELPINSCINGFAPHNIRDFTLGAPSDEICNPVTKDYYKVFKGIQIELSIEGIYWELHELRLKALPRPQTESESLCTEYPIVTICEGINTDWCLDGEYETCRILTT